MHNARDEIRPELTLYTPYVAKLVKEQLARIWDRVRKTKGLNQTQLANALETSQSAVSKLLKVDDSHPWTKNYILIFAQFCEIDLKGELLDHLPPEIADDFDDWGKSGAQVEAAFHSECESALTKYFVDRGKRPKARQVARLADRLVSRAPRQSNIEEMSKAIEAVILDAALGGE